MVRRRHFGTVRKRESGRWQVRYRGTDGRMRSAGQTFARKAEAERYLSIIEGQLARGDWVDPARARVKLGPYADRWISERAGLRPRTVELYRWLLRVHIEPTLGGVELGRIDTSLVREWRAGLLADGVSVSATAKAYRLLRAVLNTATNEDRILARNPCQIRGADQEQPGERPVLSVDEVFALADAVPKRLRVMVLVSAFASLRFGEVTALQRRDVDLGKGLVYVRRQLVEVRGEGLVPGPPKSAAGKRVVALPAAVVEELRGHLEEFVGSDATAWVFTGPQGGVIWRGNFRKFTKWTKTVAGLGLVGLHFHDLRHSGNTWAARSGVSTRDLMARMGHDSMRAALMYQHETREGDARIVAALDDLLAGRQAPEADDGEGPDGDDDDGSAAAEVTR